MSSTTLFRLAALATFLSGTCLIIDTLFIELFLPESALTNTVGYCSVLLGFFALIGTYLWQREASGYLGGIGFMINFLGLALLSGVMFFQNYIAPAFDPADLQAALAGTPRLTFLISILIFEFGVILYGIATFRSGVFPRLAALFFIMGYSAYVIEPFAPDILIADLSIRAAQVLGAVGLIWLGLALRAALQTAQVRSITSPAAI
jgi:hypothetical protein